MHPLAACRGRGRCAPSPRPDAVLCTWQVDEMLRLRPGEVWAKRIPSVRCYFPALLLLLQEDFEMFVPAERTVQLASPESSAYTDFAANPQRSSRLIQYDPDGTCAAEKIGRASCRERVWISA